jgi:hypothetical protein
MKDKYVARFNIKGRNARPDTIGMGELGDLLKFWESTIKAAVRIEDRTSDTDGGSPLVSLVDVKEGNSSDMGIAMLDYVVPAFSAISEAVATGSYSKIPSACQEGLHRISKWASRRLFEIEIEADVTQNIYHGVISRKNSVPSPASPNFSVDGLTTAWGYLLQVGGKKPRIALEFPDGSKIVITADEEVTKEVSARLYENVGIEGIATWSVSDWKMTAFRAIRLLEYRPQKSNLVDTFKELAEAAKGRWDEVDAEKFVQDLRGDGPL